MPHETYIRKLSIREWAEDDRPREKLIRRGRQSLTDAELIAILIATGSARESALDLSKKILQLTGNNLNELGKRSLSELRQIKGIGEAKAITILAALELGRRRATANPEERIQVTCSSDSFRVLHPLVSDLHHEVFWILLLNRNNQVIACQKISEGGVSGTVVDAKLVFKYALDKLASAVILCHNHPSGNLRPSEADIQLTRKLKDAGKLLDILITDHLIIAENFYYSFADEGHL